MIKYLLYTLVLFLLISLQGYSQNVIVYNDSKIESQIVKYNNEASKDIISNYIISKISKSIPKILSYTSYSYNYTKKVIIKKTALHKYNIFMAFKNKKCTGDVYYKDIFISDILFPKRVDFSIKIFDKNRNLLKEFECNNIEINWGEKKIIEFNFNDTASAPQYTVQIKNTIFHFDIKNKKAFDKKIDLINEYYSSRNQIETLFESLSTIDYNNIDMIPLFEYTLDETEQNIEELRSKEFPKELNLKKSDPIDFIEKFKKLTLKTEQTRVVLDQYLSTMDYRLYTIGKKFLAEYNSDKAILYFEKSLKTNPFYSPSHYEIAKLDFKYGNMLKSSGRITDVLNYMNPGSHYYKLISELANKVYNEYISIADKHINNKKHNKGLETLFEAKSFCNNTREIECTQELFRKITIGKYGIYNSFLIVAVKAIESDKLHLAERYILQAKEYQSQNSEDIINANSAGIEMRRLSNIYFSLAQSSVDAENYRDALDLYEKVITLSDIFPNVDYDKSIFQCISSAKCELHRQLLSKSYDALNYNNINLAFKYAAEAKKFQLANKTEIPETYAIDTIIRKINYQVYLKYINAGNNDLAYNNFDDALRNYINAREMEKEFNFPINDSLVIKMQIAVKPIILKQINLASLFLKCNQLDTAKILYRTINNLTKSYK